MKALVLFGDDHSSVWGAWKPEEKELALAEMHRLEDAEKKTAEEVDFPFELTKFFLEETEMEKDFFEMLQN